MFAKIGNKDAGAWRRIEGRMRYRVALEKLHARWTRAETEPGGKEGENEPPRAEQRDKPDR